VNKKISVTVGEKRLGDFPSEKASIETKVSSCNAALTQITQGTQAIKDQFLKKKNDEFKTCQLKVGRALDVYKKTFREVTGADLTEEQIRRLKKENGIDF
jgi:aldehyde:ferredoxin oxidoreductase